MPSRIEELIAEFRAVRANYGASSALGVYNSGKAYAYEMCAQKIERAYREEVVPMVEALRMISTLHTEYDPERNLTYDLGTVDGHRCAARFALEALRRFDAPAGTPAAKDESNGNLPRD